MDMNFSWVSYALLLFLPFWTGVILLFSPATRDQHLVSGLWTCLCLFVLSGFLLTTQCIPTYLMMLLMNLSLFVGLTLPGYFSLSIYPEFFMLTAAIGIILAPSMFLAHFGLQSFIYLGFVLGGIFHKKWSLILIGLSVASGLLWMGLALNSTLDHALGHVPTFQDWWTPLRWQSFSPWFWGAGLLMLCPIYPFSILWESFFLSSTLRWKGVGFLALWSFVFALEFKWPHMRFFPFPWIIQGLICVNLFRAVALKVKGWEGIDHQWNTLSGSFFLVFLLQPRGSKDVWMILQYGLIHQILVLFKAPITPFVSFFISKQLMTALYITLFFSSGLFIVHVLKVWTPDLFMPWALFGCTGLAGCALQAFYVKSFIGMRDYPKETSLGIYIFLAGIWTWNALNLIINLISL
jgi:hypothetical protein